MRIGLIEVSQSGMLKADRAMFIPLDLMLETLPGYAPVRKGRASVGAGTQERRAEWRAWRESNPRPAASKAG